MDMIDKVLMLLAAVTVFLGLSTIPKLTPILMSVVSFITQSLFLFYRTLAVIMALLTLVVPVYYLFTVDTPDELKWAAGVLSLFALAFLSTAFLFKDNIHRNYTFAFNKIVDQFIAWIGTVKYFKSPYILVADPKSYAIKGHEIRKLIDPDSPFCLKKGDILLRGYNGYVDGEMIKLTGGQAGLGKYFSHAALFVGELTEEDRSIAARRLRTKNDQGIWEEASEEDKNQVRNNRKYFQTGKQMVIHSMTQGVFVEDILTFARCDYLAVLRLNKDVQLDPEDVEKLQQNSSFISMEQSYLEKKFMVTSDAVDIEKRLKQGQKVAASEILESVKNSALGKIGSCYDFQFTDIEKAHQFSCSEFVYYCFKSLRYYFGMVPVKHALMKVFFSRTTITPSDIYDATARRDNLDIIWLSNSLKKDGKKINQEYQKWKDTFG